MQKVFMALAVVGLLVVVGVCMNGCTGSSGNGHTNGGNTAIPSNLTPAQQVLVNALPSDPGEAGKQTIEGIDSDHDGVRDDVQRYIVLNYLDSAKMRAGLTQYAKAFQRVLLEADDKEASFNNQRKASAASDCLLYLIPDFDEYRRVKGMLREELINTQDRKSADDHYNDRLSGGAFYLTPTDQLAASCTFNPNQLED